MNNHKKTDTTTAARHKTARWTVIFTEFIVLFIFWIILSGRLQLKYLLIGMFASALVTYLTNDFIFSSQSDEKEIGLRYIFKSIWGFLVYLPWLIFAIIKANILVASIILKPRMPIDPAFIKFESKMSKKVSLVTLANSITLTPGTVTVELVGGKYVVHSLVHECAEDLEKGVMQNKVAKVFNDNRETNPPDCEWIHSSQEMEK